MSSRRLAELYRLLSGRGLLEYTQTSRTRIPLYLPGHSARRLLELWKHTPFLVMYYLGLVLIDSFLSMWMGGGRRPGWRSISGGVEGAMLEFRW